MRASEHRHGAARAVLAAATVALGLTLLFGGLSLPVAVAVGGVSLLVIGAASVVGAVARTPDDLGGRREPRWPAIAAGGLGIVAGLVVLVWHAVSVRVLVAVVSGALIAYGAAGIVRGIRGERDRRAGEIFAGAATIVAATLPFAWPVLAIWVFTAGLGAWLLFTGARTLLEPLVHRRGGRSSRSWGWPRTVPAAGAFAVAVVLAVGSAIVLHGDGRQAPGAFYTPPGSVPGKPGMLVRAERLPAVAPAGTEVWRILYTTTHPDGSATVASGTVIAPVRRGATPLPLLSVAHGTSGIVPRCAPSLSRQPFADGAESALLDMVTKHGWAAVSTDYTGLGTAGTHPYLVGQAEARSVLDASRAAARLPSLKLGDATVVWGHSQGGHAALWTGQIARAYAPGLMIKGIAALAPATDLYALARSGKTDIGGKTIAAYIATAWDAAYPRLDLAARLSPGTAQGVEQVSRLCFNQKDAIAALLRGSQIPRQVFPDALLDGELGTLLRANTPTGPFSAPVLVAQGTADPLVTPAMQDAWVKKRCKAGVPIDYRRIAGRGHMELVAADSPLNPQLIKWTLDRWKGKPDALNCENT